jgi:hypothetical protein
MQNSIIVGLSIYHSYHATINLLKTDIRAYLEGPYQSLQSYEEFVYDIRLSLLP